MTTIESTEEGGTKTKRQVFSCKQMRGKAGVVMQRLSHLTETVLSHRITRNSSPIIQRQSQKTIKTATYQEIRGRATTKYSVEKAESSLLLLLLFNLRNNPFWLREGSNGDRANVRCGICAK